MPAGLGLLRIRSLAEIRAGDGTRTRDFGVACRRVASTLHPQMVQAVGAPATRGGITSSRCPFLLEAHLASLHRLSSGRRGGRTWRGPRWPHPPGSHRRVVGAVRWGAPARGGRCVVAPRLSQNADSLSRLPRWVVDGIENRYVPPRADARRKREGLPGRPGSPPRTHAFSVVSSVGEAPRGRGRTADELTAPAGGSSFGLEHVGVDQRHGVSPDRESVLTSNLLCRCQTKISRVRSVRRARRGVLHPGRARICLRLKTVFKNAIVVGTS